MLYSKLTFHHIEKNIVSNTRAHVFRWMIRSQTNLLSILWVSIQPFLLLIAMACIGSRVSRLFSITFKCPNFKILQKDKTKRMVVWLKNIPSKKVLHRLVYGSIVS